MRYYNASVPDRRTGKEKRENHPQTGIRKTAAECACDHAAISEKNQLEIYPTLQFKQPAFPEQDLFVVGITKGYEEAVELVEQIVQEVYEQTGGCDIRSYILEKEQGR